MPKVCNVIYVPNEPNENAQIQDEEVIQIDDNSDQELIQFDNNSSVINENVQAQFYHPKVITTLQQIFPYIKPCSQKRVLKDWPINTKEWSKYSETETLQSSLSRPKAEIEQQKFKIPKLKLGALILQKKEKKEKKEQKRKDRYNNPEQGTSTGGFSR